MASFGEACTHIGAVLYYLEATTNSSNRITCTFQVPEVGLALVANRLAFNFTLSSTDLSASVLALVRLFIIN